MGIIHNGDYSYIRILGIIALFTIILAAINYINLATAQQHEGLKKLEYEKCRGQ